MEEIVRDLLFFCCRVARRRLDNVILGRENNNLNSLLASYFLSSVAFKARWSRRSLIPLKTIKEKHIITTY